MASKIVFLTLVLSFCKVQSQSGCCFPNSQPSSSSKGQSSYNGCGKSQPQTIQFQPSNNNGVKASPQLQIVPGQNCNLQTIPLSQLLSQSQMPSSCAQCTQPQSCDSNPSVITAPVSTITIPPTTCTTIIDNSLSNCLANALQMLIANGFINSAISNNIVNQDCMPIPVVETSVPSFDLSSFLKNLNANQLQQCQSSGTSAAATLPCSQPDDGVQGYGLRQLLENFQDNQCSQPQPKNIDWMAVLNYLNSQYKEPEPEYDCSSFINSLKKMGKTACQNTQQYPQETNYNFNYNLQLDDQSSQGDIYSGAIDAIKTYLGKSSGSSYGNVPEVMFPKQIPAELVCNYGYMTTEVPVVSFKVAPLGDPNSKFILSSPTC